MSIEALERLITPAPLKTSGIEWREFRFDPNRFDLPEGEKEIAHALRTLMGVKDMSNAHDVCCWSDVLCDVGTDDFYTDFTGVYMMGVFYAEDRFGREKLTHFFLRELRNFRASLDRWKDDLAYPSGTRQYSVCAVLPNDFVMPKPGLSDPHNHAVTQITWDRAKELGADMDAIVARMRRGQ